MGGHCTDLCSNNLFSGEESFAINLCSPICMSVPGLELHMLLESKFRVVHRPTATHRLHLGNFVGSLKLKLKLKLATHAQWW